MRVSGHPAAERGARRAAYREPRPSRGGSRPYAAGSVALHLLLEVLPSGFTLCRGQVRHATLRQECVELGLQLGVCRFRRSLGFPISSIAGCRIFSLRRHDGGAISAFARNSPRAGASC